MDNEKVCRFAEKCADLAKEMGVELYDFAEGGAMAHMPLGWFAIYCREVKHEG